MRIGLLGLGIGLALLSEVGILRGAAGWLVGFDAVAAAVSVILSAAPRGWLRRHVSPPFLLGAATLLFSVSAWGTGVHQWIVFGMVAFGFAYLLFGLFEATVAPRLGRGIHRLTR